MTDLIECPRCLLIRLHPEEGRNALSRRDNKTYICSPCGSDEAMFDLAIKRFETDLNVLQSQCLDRLRAELAWTTTTKEEA